MKNPSSYLEAQNHKNYTPDVVLQNVAAKPSRSRIARCRQGRSQVTLQFDFKKGRKRRGKKRPRFCHMHTKSIGLGGYILPNVLAPCHWRAAESVWPPKREEKNVAQRVQLAQRTHVGGVCFHRRFLQLRCGEWDLIGWSLEARRSFCKVKAIYTTYLVVYASAADMTLSVCQWLAAWLWIARLREASWA